MGNSRSSQALQEENISQIEADTGCKCTYLNTLRQNINFANDLDYLLIYTLLFNYFIKSLPIKLNDYGADSLHQSCKRRDTYLKISKEYLLNLLVNTFWVQIFVFQVRDLKFWLLAYFFFLLICAESQQDWTTLILDIL